MNWLSEYYLRITAIQSPYNLRITSQSFSKPIAHTAQKYLFGSEPSSRPAAISAGCS